MFLRARQDDAKGRAVIDLGLILESAAMFFNYARRDRQAQPGASLFSGKERIEKTLLNLSRDALAGVHHFQDDDGGRLTRLRPEATAQPAHQGHDRASSTECNRPVPSDAFRRVLNEVDQHLFDLLRVNPNPQVGDEGKMQSDGSLLQLRPKRSCTRRNDFQQVIVTNRGSAGRANCTLSRTIGRDVGFPGR